MSKISYLVLFFFIMLGLANTNPVSADPASPSALDRCEANPYIKTANSNQDINARAVVKNCLDNIDIQWELTSSKGHSVTGSINKPNGEWPLIEVAWPLAEGDVVSLRVFGNGEESPFDYTVHSVYHHQWPVRILMEQMPSGCGVQIWGENDPWVLVTFNGNFVAYFHEVADEWFRQYYYDVEDEEVTVRVQAWGDPGHSELLADYSETFSNECYVDQNSINIEVSCQGVHVTGNTEEATDVSWAFNGESGTQSVAAGDIDFTAGTAVVTYGPHDLTGSAEMTVDGTLYQDDDEALNAICGQAQGSLQVEVSCQGVHVTGNTEEATDVSWAFNGESGTQSVAAGDIDFTAGTAVVTYGPHDLTGSAEMTVDGTLYQDDDEALNAICGEPESPDEATLTASCLTPNDLLLQGTSQDAEGNAIQAVLVMPNGEIIEPTMSGVTFSHVFEGARQFIGQSIVLVAGNGSDTLLITEDLFDNCPETTGCIPDGIAPVDVFVKYWNTETGWTKLEHQWIALDVLDEFGNVDHTYLGETDHDAGYVRLFISREHWNRNTILRYWYDGREVAIEWTSVEIDWLGTELFGFWECALAEGTVYLRYDAPDQNPPGENPPAGRSPLWGPDAEFVQEKSGYTRVGTITVNGFIAPIVEVPGISTSGWSEAGIRRDLNLIGAHSTDYEDVGRFGWLFFGLESGDVVTIELDGVTTSYTVTLSETVDRGPDWATRLQNITTNGITLFTCEGADAFRVVHLEPVS